MGSDESRKAAREGAATPAHFASRAVFDYYTGRAAEFGRADSKVSVKQLGRYEILGELGRGAMGRVYRARDPRIDRVVALKTVSVAGIPPAEEEEYRQRFFREAQAAGKLSHPGLVTIHDVGEDEATGTPFIVMEFIEGQTLERLAAPRLRLNRALDLTVQVAEALDYAHGREIIHRDIKPANIIVTREGRAKITDFGIAKLATSQVTQAGQILGTPAYMSPEQLNGEEVDGRSDLFSLGVILYWLVTGRKPFPGDSATTVSYQVVHKNPRPVSELNPELTSDFDHVVGRALAKDPLKRYQEGKELAADLDDLRAGRRPRSLAGGAGVEASEGTVVAQRASSASTQIAPVPWRSRRWVVSARDLYVKILPVLMASKGAGLRFSRRCYEKTRETASHLKRLSEMAWRSPRTQEALAWGKHSLGYARRISLKTYALAGLGVVLLIAGTSIASWLGPKSTLEVRCQHNFRSAELTLWADGERVFRGEMVGTVKERLGGLLTSVEGNFAEIIQIPAGERAIRVRVSAPEEGYEQTSEVEGEFQENGKKTLYIGFGGRSKRLYLSLRE